MAGHKLQLTHYSPFLTKLLQMVKEWKRTKFTYADKLVLIKSVLQGLFLFWLSALPVPVSVLDQANSIYLHFLWAYSNSGNNMALVSWKQVCLPREEGGLGLLYSKSGTRLC